MELLLLIFLLCIIPKTCIICAASYESNNSPIIAESNLKAALHRSNVDNVYQFLNQKANENHGRTSSNSLNSGNHGDVVKINHNKETGESGGKKKTFFDEDDHSSSDHKQKQFSNAGKFNAKKDQKRTKSEKGYRNRYHQDEYHKVNDFFKDHHEGGAYKRFGSTKNKHKSNKGTKLHGMNRRRKVILITMKKN